MKKIMLIVTVGLMMSACGIEDKMYVPGNVEADAGADTDTDSDSDTDSDTDTDKCAGIVCENPPNDVCSGDDLRVYASEGKCDDGECVYEPSVEDCGVAGCESKVGDDECIIDPCAGVVCDDPPHNVCSGDDLRVYASEGKCDDGECIYEFNTEECGSAGCLSIVGHDECIIDPCAGVVCENLPNDVCSGDDLRVYAPDSGTCVDGTCVYDYEVEDCGIAGCESKIGDDVCQMGTECDDDNMWYCPSGQECVEGWCIPGSGDECLYAWDCQDGLACEVAGLNHGYCREVPALVDNNWYRCWDSALPRFDFRSGMGPGTANDGGTCHEHSANSIDVWSPEISLFHTEVISAPACRFYDHNTYNIGADEDFRAILECCVVNDSGSSACLGPAFLVPTVRPGWWSLYLEGSALSDSDNFGDF